jgi:hypothetical protein
MKVKLEVHKLQQNQQLSQPMYGIEPLFIDQESFLDSEIQMTPYDASLYESIAGSHGTSVTLSYLTSTQVQHTVAMTNEPGQSTSTQRNDRLTAQEQILPHLLTRANCVRQKSMINNQNNNSQNRQYVRQTSTMPSSARLYHFPNSMLVVQNQCSQKDYGLDSGDVTEETQPKVVHESSQTLKNKKTDEMRKSHKIPFSENWNEQETREEENPENDDQDEDYENIWKSTH